MTNAFRVALLSAALSLAAAPAFADPGSYDPPPPPGSGGSQVVTTTIVTAILTAMGL